MTIDQLVERVWSGTVRSGDGLGLQPNRRDTELVVRAAVESLGFNIAPDGEIVDPRPAPRSAWDAPQPPRSYRGKGYRR